MLSVSPRVTQLLATVLNLDSTDLAILNDITRQCRNHATAATRAMSFKVNLSVRAIRYRLAKLAKIGLVSKVGKRKGWILSIPAKNPV